MSYVLTIQRDGIKELHGPFHSENEARVYMSHYADIAVCDISLLKKEEQCHIAVCKNHFGMNDCAICKGKTCAHHSYTRVLCVTCLKNTPTKN